MPTITTNYITSGNELLDAVHAARLRSIQIEVQYLSLYTRIGITIQRGGPTHWLRDTEMGFLQYERTEHLCRTFNSYADSLKAKDAIEDAFNVRLNMQP